MLGRQKVVPITSCDSALKKIEAWTVFCTVFLGDSSIYQATQELEDLVGNTEGFGTHIHAQTQRQPSFPAALIFHLKYEFNKSFRHALERRHRVRWPCLEDLWRQLTTIHFSTDRVYILGAISSSPPIPTAQHTYSPHPTTPSHPPP